MIDTLLAGNLLDKKDIKISPKSERIKLVLFCVYLIAIGLFGFFYPKLSYLATYFQSGILLIVCLNLVVNMLRNSVFLNRDITTKDFLENNKEWTAKSIKQ